MINSWPDGTQKNYFFGLIWIAMGSLTRKTKADDS